jgi:hypothetical protein
MTTHLSWQLRLDSVGRDEKQQEPSCAAGGVQTGTAILEHPNTTSSTYNWMYLNDLLTGPDAKEISSVSLKGTNMEYVQ